MLKHQTKMVLSLFIPLIIISMQFISFGDVPLKEAKLNVEHNATDEDTGFQGFIDSSL